MKEKNVNEKDIMVYPDLQKPANVYDDGNIPREDLPQDIIPDEVPRKDGPGGDNKNSQNTNNRS